MGPINITATHSWATQDAKSAIGGENKNYT